MKRQTKQLNPAKQFENFFSRDLDDYINETPEDSALYESMSEYMKARFDLEDVKNDPGLPVMESVVKEIISDYNKNSSKNKNNEKFIRDAFSEIPEEQLLDEISNIRYEITNSNINDISTEWVREWHENRQKNGTWDARQKEIKHFIDSSLEIEERKPQLILNAERKHTVRPMIIRYVSLAAAAVVGIFLILNTLVPVSDPDKLFNTYYETPAAVSPVTRSLNDNYPLVYTSAIENYNKGDYEAAAMGFTSSISQEPSALAARYLLGITEMELKNYDNAIKILSNISGKNGEYSKEAKWYLGLSYLKTGKTEKASECFNSLANNSGYYGKRSEKILRGLK